jgi:hypothetical protein
MDDLGVGVRIPLESRIFTSPHFLCRFCGPPSCLLNDIGIYFPGVNRQEREADHSSQTSEEVNKVPIYAENSTYVLIELCLIG